MPIGISAPTENETFNVRDSISMAWVADNTTDNMRVTFFGWCEPTDNTEPSNRIRLSHAVDVLDTGSLTIAIEDIVKAGFSSVSTLPNGAVCSTTISMKREKIESDFESGTITATQYDNVEVTIVL